VEKVAWALVNVHILDLGKALLDHALTLHLVNNQNEESVLTACIRAAIAYYYDVKQDLQTAEKMYNNAIEIVVSIHGTWKIKEAIWIAVLKALVLFMKSKFEECEEFCYKVLDGLQEVYGDEVILDKGNLQLILGRACMRRVQYSKAMTFLEQAQAIFHKLKDRSQVVSVMSTIGLVYYYQDRHSEALEVCKKCIKEAYILYRTKVNTQVVNDLSIISIIYAGLGHFRTAYLYGKEALELNIELAGTPMTPSIIIPMANLANLMRFLGDVDGSLRVLANVERMIMKLGMEGRFEMGFTLTLKARGYHEKGLHAEALPYCLQGLELIKKAIGNETSLQCLNVLKARASIMKSLNRFTESREDYELCLKREVEYFKTRKNERIAITLVEMGSLCRLEGKIEEGLSHLREARCILKELFGDRDNRVKADLSYELGLVYIDTGNIAEAKVELESAAGMIRRVFGDDDHPKIKLVKVALKRL
jgi:tetratricopeptide (TPR) repeat protein